MSGNGDYISREAALGLIDRYWQQAYNAHFLDAAVRLGSVYREMEEIPAADVRSVVFCKDCKWYQIDELKKDGTEDRRYKPSVCVLAEQRRDPNHFCADGKKREES